MAINNLPPQAYTRETVAEAFEWMKTQSPTTRDLAKDANTLVSLYLNAKRHKRIKNMQPGDTAEFQNELKSLAKGIKQFNQDSEQAQPNLNVNIERKPTNTVSDAQKESIDQAIASLQFKTDPVVSEPIHKPNLVNHTNNEFINPQDILKTNHLKESSNVPALKPTTQSIINQTKSALNLSSNEEALNALVALGFEHIKSIFKLKSGSN